MMLRYLMDLVWMRAEADRFLTCFVTNHKAGAALVPHAVKVHAH